MCEEKIVVDKNAHISNIASKIEVANGNAVAKVSFTNLGYGVITAIKFIAKGFNAFGDPILIAGKEKFYLIIQDIHVDRHDAAENLIAAMPSGEVRKLELEEYQVCYEDGTITSYKGKDNYELTVEPIDKSDVDTCDALKDKYGLQIKYVPQKLADGWLCGCGALNKLERKFCYSCDNSYDDMMMSSSKSGIDEIKLQYQEKKKLQEREEQQRVAFAIKQKQKKRRTVACISIVIVILCTIFWYFYQMSLRKKYSSDDEMMEDLQGIYTLYDGYTAERQYLINGDKASYIYKYDSIYPLESTIKWYPAKGKFHTFEDVIVLKDGSLNIDGDIYERGGTMTISGTGNREYISSSNGISKVEVGSDVLKITQDKITDNSSYTICTGSITNTGSKTYKYVTVKGSFKDKDGNVVDTDWTYAVGSEGLAPGESSTFRLSVDRRYDASGFRDLIQSCSVTLLDYDD